MDIEDARPFSSDMFTFFQIEWNFYQIQRVLQICIDWDYLRT